MCCLSGGRGSGSLGRVSSRSVSWFISLALWDFVFLSGAVDSDLDSDLTTIDILTVHLLDGLHLEGLRSKGDETEATALAGFTTGLELLDHEVGDGAEGDLRGNWLVGSKELLQLFRVSIRYENSLSV